ncbi:MAG: NADPH-dependent glutamate synthase [Peptococcaceae bacterium]|jgi:glutamate synthase (NADPH/NADH) small chain|nr:NADPH-dependent glutamate synthase [Peptococcaceae bacterium]
MPNMSLKKNEMPAQAPDVRSGNFLEVALGYTEALAVDEAARCLNCRNKPCVEDCPVGIDIPAFIARIGAGEFEAAYEIIARYNSLPAICGRVCPQESQCEGKCVRGRRGEPVAIGRLERFAADYHNSRGGEAASRPAANGHKVAVIGSGPAGLACAGSLAKKGYQVTIFEALHMPGGVLVYGIPEFRLPKAIVRAEIEGLRAMGVEIVTDVVVGRSLLIEDLMEREGREAVFIGSGAGLPSFMGIPGENLNGVYSANEFLTRINLMKAYQEDSETPVYRGSKVAVVGGGNVAMDAARCARRLGAEVTVVYRRTEKELPARLEEVEHAKEEGVVFHTLTAPTSINGDKGWVASLTCQRMVLGEPDASGRARPSPLAGSEFTLVADCVVMAIGTSPNPLIKATTKGLETQRWGGIVTDESTGQTSLPGVYAGGDAVTGAATVILAMGAGKTAAEGIDRYIRGGGAE